MTIPNTSVQPARQGDWSQLAAILDRANQYAFEKTGKYQWQFPDNARNELRQDLQQGNCFVMKDKAGNITAAIALSEEDTTFWGQEGSDGRALYFHKLMKDPTHAAPNSGRILLSFAASEALRRGKQVLRCDAKVSMEKIIKYYESLSFQTKHHIRYAISGNPAVLLEADPHEIIKRVKNRS